MSKSYYNISHFNRGTIVWAVFLIETNLFLSSQLQTDNNKIADTFCILILNYFFKLYKITVCVKMIYLVLKFNEVKRR